MNIQTQAHKTITGICRNLERIRKKKGVSLKSVATHTGLPVHVIRKLETGGYPDFKFYLIAVLANYYKVSMTEVFAGN